MGYADCYELHRAPYPFVANTALGLGNKIYEQEATQVSAIELLNEISTVWCEGDLVMSRLFIDKEGNAVAHPNKEIDDCSIPPWEIP